MVYILNEQLKKHITWWKVYSQELLFFFETRNHTACKEHCSGKKSKAHGRVSGVIY
jgi:hypothetical protein